MLETLATGKKGTTERKKVSYQFFVLVLHFEPGRDAVPGVEEGLPLGVLHEVVHEEADQVDGHEHQEVGSHLKRKKEGVNHFKLVVIRFRRKQICFSHFFN